MHGFGAGLAEGERAGAAGGAGGVDVVDEEDISALECIRVGRESGGGEFEALGAGFGSLGIIHFHPFERGDVTGVGCAFGQMLREVCGVVVAAFADAGGVAGDGDDQEFA